MAPPMKRIRVGPARLCLRRRCRACRDISGGFEITVPACAFLLFGSPRALPSLSDDMNSETSELAIVDSASPLVGQLEREVPRSSIGVAPRWWALLRAG